MQRGDKISPGLLPTLRKHTDYCQNEDICHS